MEGKGSFLPVLPFTLELGRLQPVRRNEEHFFRFVFRKAFWEGGVVVKVLGKILLIADESCVCTHGEWGQ